MGVRVCMTLIGGVYCERKVPPGPVVIAAGSHWVDAHLTVSHPGISKRAS